MLKKAFDSIDRNALWKTLRYLGIPEKLINVLTIVFVDVQFMSSYIDICNIRAQHMANLWK